MKSINFAGQELIPSKIVCVGRNYVDHIKELDNEVPSEPVIFIKPNSAIGLELSSFSDEAIHYEAELAFIIQNACIAGVAFGLDLTKRKLQNYLKGKSLPWERAKAFDGSALFSEFVAINEDLSELTLELKIDGKIKQKGGVSLMINKPQKLIDNIQSFLTLVNNDIVMTGTPEGVGQIEKGQVFSAFVYKGTECIINYSWAAK